MDKNLVNSNQIDVVEQKKLKELIQAVLDKAKTQGATAAAVAGHVDAGLQVNVRLGEVDTVEFHRDKGLAVTVYYGQKRGTASTSDMSASAIDATVKAACDIAKVTGEDEFSGLADRDQLAFDYPDLDLWHPWAMAAPEAIDLAKRTEAIGLAYDKRINNSEGASVSTGESFYVYGNSHGFIGAYPLSSHSISTVYVAEENGAMQRDYYYTSARDPEQLLDIHQVAEEAARRTVRRLGARPIKTQEAPVLFVPEMASSLIGHLLGAIRGTAQYRGTTFLHEQLHQSICVPWMHIYEDPLRPNSLGSAPFDNEGVRTYKHDLVKDGVLESYILGSYSARRLGLTTTGNAGGVRNVFVAPGQDDFNALLKRLDTGLLVTEAMGHGVNLTTGDYSRGAAGFWVEQGEIQHPVEEITIAGNLRDMFQEIQAVGSDVDHRRNIKTGSILLTKMMIAGRSE